MNKRIMTGLFVISLVAGTSVMGILVLNQLQEDNTISLTLLENAGLMIETKGLRIYVDPYNLRENWTYSADAVLITHPHGDHYDANSINQISTEETTIVMPENMSTQIDTWSAAAINPGDSVQIGEINVTAFYSYTLPVDGWPASHPREANYCSYIIDIDGFTIFHAGDSKVIPEYEQIAEQIDVVCLPLGPGCQTMTGMEIIDAINTLEAQYYIPIHYQNIYDVISFLNTYDTQLEEASITSICLDNYESYEFTIG
ncbi:MAG: hypothetical protein GF411_09310 [Candidatus Lokiarchaeota archaeon]|nr:hypothetical protein [Candidatus Lokiarchaeota archaeon]